ncbi:unnamed protein product [Microthlaspi erraticum]|uniref:Uncharacterized protein n=1 Tax=Microthlaspi erraticum TaxID=1685480 RepID=A0A6D2K2X1_9BRAS|nr:unnamed protein product [Microthlaspi erraticum]CAA7049738.1 unnamed protein product [Microthlaspi erraticum]
MNRTHRDFTPSNPNPFEDPKVRLRHHSLKQDYQELHMNTEATRKKLQIMRERKATLMAEVRFLRRRYRHLRQDQPQDIKKVRGRSNDGKKKNKTQIRMEVSPNKSSVVETKHVTLPDLNQSGRVQDETKTSPKKRVPLFDLNQISGEEEEETEAMNNNDRRIRVVEENSSCKRMSSSIEMQQKEMKLSSCRNGGNGSNKRKISWQDPVSALRV